MYFVFCCLIIFIKICKTIQTIFWIIVLCFGTIVLCLVLATKESAKHLAAIISQDTVKDAFPVFFTCPVLGLTKIIYTPTPILQENVDDIKSKMHLPHHPWVGMHRNCNFWTNLRQLNHFSSVAFHIETSHLFCRAKEMTSFYMKHYIGLKAVKQLTYLPMTVTLSSKF